MLLVGNDIVDLSLDETFGKESDQRFLRRALGPEELIELDAVADRKIFLWSVWSAKETAYKIGKKIDPKLRFIPREFRVSMGPLGTVSWNGGRSVVQWEYGPDWIHCAGVDQSQDERFTHVRTRISPVVDDALTKFSAEERASIHSDASASVRMAAREILSGLGFQEVEILRHPNGDRYDPPKAYSRGQPLPECDVSLSHHGKYAAAAVLITNRGP